MSADDPGILSLLGIKVSAMFAGMAGGIVGAWATGASGWRANIGYVVSGFLTANFLSVPALHVLPDWVGEGGAGFIIGLSAMGVCTALIAMVNKWAPSLGGKTDV